MFKRWRILAMVSFGVLAASPATAGLAEAVTLDQLVGESRVVIVGKVLDSHSVREAIGGRSRIVTYTRVHVEEQLAGTNGDKEVMVRTLGGRVGDVAEIVHGAARLDRRQPAVMFLRERDPNMYGITAETQGVYPLHRGTRGELMLMPSRDLAKLLGKLDRSAALQLRGQSLRNATNMIRSVYSRLLAAPKLPIPSRTLPAPSKP
ncbi:MAG: hypothetical protein SFV15_07730 [Polyangiaceae bacterium]|nr:hypothetical protein [Polyangiaceae bacterium]